MRHLAGTAACLMLAACATMPPADSQLLEPCDPPVLVSDTIPDRNAADALLALGGVALIQRISAWGTRPPRLIG
jgi:hypothetical protein